MKKIKEILGAIILILACLCGFIFPLMAKWILLGLVGIGLFSWLTKWTKEAQN